MFQQILNLTLKGQIIDSNFDILVFKAFPMLHLLFFYNFSY